LRLFGQETLTKTLLPRKQPNIIRGIAIGKSAALLLVLVFLTASCTVIAEPSSSDKTKENSWTTKSPMPQAISGIKAAVANGKIYVMTADVNYEYDPVADNWTAKTPMPTARYGFGIAVCQDKIYVIGGENRTYGYVNYLSTNEVYDPLTDTWETKKPMPTSRYELEANAVNGRIYLIGGITDNYRSIHTAVNEVYDPTTDSWTTKQQAPFAVARYASAVVENKIYIMGGGLGFNERSRNETLNQISNQIYNAEKDTWSLGASLPTYTYYAAAGATAGVMAPKRIYVVGGGFTETTNAVRVYDPAWDNWTFGTPMSTNRTSLAIGVVDDVIYAMGGNLGWEGGEWSWEGYPLGTTDIVEQYTPFGYETIMSEPFPIALVAATSVAIVAVVGAGLLVYFKKRKR
jgi:N-acetylneuraminic acid mutarotase